MTIKDKDIEDAVELITEVLSISKIFVFVGIDNNGIARVYHTPNLEVVDAVAEFVQKIKDIKPEEWMN